MAILCKVSYFMRIKMLDCFADEYLTQVESYHLPLANSIFW